MKLSKLSGALFVMCVALLAGALIAGCGDDDGASPTVITVADFEGYWEITMYKLTNASNPAQVVEIVAAGAEMAWRIDNAGNFTGEAFVPAALAGQDVKFPFLGAVAMVGQDSVSMSFTPEIEPFLTDATVAFQLSGNTLTMEGNTATFDFDQDGTEEAAIFEATVVRGTRVIAIDDFEGVWQATSYRVTDASNPAVTMEIISMGATFSWDADAAGAFTGDMFLPAALAGEDLNLQFQGAFQLVGQDSVQVTFTPEIPPFLTASRAEFSVWGGIFALKDENTTFDFDEDGTDEAAIFEGTMMWTGF